MDLDLKAKVVLVTGSSKGIGLATAKAFAREGAHVVLNGRCEADLAKSVAELSQISDAVSSHTADVCDPTAAESLVADCVGRLGAIDILVNNVGGVGGAARLEGSTDEEWLAVFDRNLLQLARMTRLVIPHMRRRGGVITNISSISGVKAEVGRSGQYGSAKAALIYLAERWALELVSDNIRVNAVSPGSVYCEGTGWDRYKKRNPAGFEEYERTAFPMGRFGKPEEIADVVVFLCSPRAGWINGRHIVVDGLQRPLDILERRLV